jgi:tRNA (Thr-GGU) A37 N-methylase
MEERFILKPVGRVKAEKDEFWIMIDEPFRGALAKLGMFSHALVLWWAHEHDNEGDRNRTDTALPTRTTSTPVFLPAVPSIGPIQWP